MIEVNPGATFTFEITGFPTGLVGTLGVVILNTDGSVQTARSTTGITEDPTGDHGNPKYTATLTAGAAGRFALQGDDGAGVYTDLEDLIIDYASALPTSSFASVADLEARLRPPGGFTAEEQTQAAALLAQATGLIQDSVKQQFFYTAADTLTMPSTWDDTFRLPQRPVISIASITLGGVTVDPSAWYLDGDRVVLTPAFSGFAYLWGAGRTHSWGGPQNTLTVVYEHGYHAIPSTLSNICMEMVIRAWVNPGSVARETVGDTATVYDNNRFSPTGLLMADTDVEKVKELFGRTAGTVQAR